MILGAGPSSLQLARRLSEDGSLPETLVRAGTAQALHFVALTGSDEVNIVTCSVAAAEYPRTARVARVPNSYFTGLAPSSPSWRRAATRISCASTTRNSSCAPPRLAATSLFAGRSLRESRAALGRDFLAAALEREEGMEVPSGDTVPRVGETLYLLGSPRDLSSLLGEPYSPVARYRKIVIAGGIGRFIAEGFLGTGKGEEIGLSRGRGRIFGRKGRRDIVIVERSIETCKLLSRDLPGALVLNRDLSDEDIFLEEGLGRAELLIAVTPDQELNLLSAARAKDYGIGRCLTLSENNAYVGLAERLGVDGVISVKSNVVSSIAEYLRGGSLRTLHSFFDRGLKILELRLGEGSAHHGAAMRDLRPPRGALVIYVNRKGCSSLPAGDTRLASGDRLGVFASMDAIRDVERLLLGEGA